MTRKSIIALAALLLASLVTVSACAGIMSSSERQRYRVTVTISTPEGDKIGSAVREAGHYYEKSILPEQGGHFYSVIKGQAAVDLGQRGFLFVLMNDQEAMSAFKMRSRKEGSPYVLSPDKYPALIYFSNLEDPKTAKSLFYKISCKQKKWSVGEDLDCAYQDSMAAVLGAGVKIKEISMQLTNEQPDGDILSILPWLKTVRNSYISGGHAGGPAFYQQLESSLFIVGE